MSAPTKYLDTDTIDDVRNALGYQVPIEKIARHLGVGTDDLRIALDLPDRLDFRSHVVPTERDQPPQFNE